MNIRYADTPAQKELKRVTAERRQFRTNEYNIGAYGTPLVGLNPTLYNQQTQWRRALPISRRSGLCLPFPFLSRADICRSGLSSSSSSDDHNVMKHSGTRRGISEYAPSQSVFSKF